MRRVFLLTCFILFFLLNHPLYLKANNDDKMQQVFRKLVIVIPNHEDYVQLTIFICKSTNVNNYIQKLFNLLNSEEEFKKLASEILKEAKEASERTIDPEIARIWAMIAKSELNPDDSSAKSDPKFNLNIEDYIRFHIPAYTFAKALRAIPADQQIYLMSFLKTLGNIGGSRGLLFGKLHNALSNIFAFQKEFTQITIVVTVAYESWTNIQAWRHGEITGKRCAKNIIDDIASVTGTVAGSQLGATIGTSLLPGVGTILGTIIGGLIGGVGAGIISDYLTRWIFDLPPTIALENAYNFLDVSPSCTNEEVNKAYHRLALKYHPDRGGSEEQFLRLTISVALIKQSREGKQQGITQKEDL